MPSEVTADFGLSLSEAMTDFETVQAQDRAPRDGYWVQARRRIYERRGFEEVCRGNIDGSGGRHGAIIDPPSPSEATVEFGLPPSEATGGAEISSHSRLQIFGAVALFWAMSLSMVFTNKAVLGNASVPSAPMFVSWFQCIIPTVFCFVAPKVGFPFVPAWEVRKDHVIEAIPLSFAFTGMILLNNLCLRFVELSFYSVARSLTIVCSFTLDFVLLGQRTSLPAIGCCGIVIAGFLLGNQQELHWSLSGGFFGLGASIFVALNAVFVKKMLPFVDNNPWKIILYTHLLASFLFLPIIALSGEMSVILHTPALCSPKFWALVAGAGLMSVGISFAIANQIKFTSPLTHNVSATAKAAAQTILALAVYQNPITFLGSLSVAIILLGSLAYTLVRRSEMYRHAAEELDDSSEKQPLISKG